MAFGRTMPAIHPRRGPRFHPLRVFWLLCLVIGLGMVLSFAYGMWTGFESQQRLNQQWRGTAGAPVTAAHGIDPSLKRPVKGLDFAIRIPKLGYFAAVREGVGSGVLYSGPGHYPETVWPGDAGTVGVAAHNVYWINFPKLGKGDEVDIETRYGLYRYRVTGTRIVNPDDRTVLIPHSDGYHLTLTTCWPLWAGAFATQRYVIFAEQVWPVAIRPSYT
jgi:sortase A